MNPSRSVVSSMSAQATPLSQVRRCGPRASITKWFQSRQLERLLRLGVAGQGVEPAAAALRRKCPPSRRGARGRSRTGSRRRGRRRSCSCPGGCGTGCPSCPARRACSRVRAGSLRTSSRSGGTCCRRARPRRRSRPPRCGTSRRRRPSSSRRTTCRRTGGPAFGPRPGAWAGERAAASSTPGKRAAFRSDQRFITFGPLTGGRERPVPGLGRDACPTILHRPPMRCKRFLSPPGPDGGTPLARYSRLDKIWTCRDP